MERICGVDEFLDFTAGVCCPAATIRERIACHQGDWPTVEPREAGDDRFTVHLAPLEEGTSIDQSFDNRSNFIDLANIARDGVDKPFDPAIWMVLLRAARRHIVNRCRQVGEKASGALKSFFFGIDRMINGAAPELNFPTAQFILSQFLAQTLNDRGTGDEEGGVFLNHNRVMSRSEMGRTETRY